jgi:SAM-dependent methyltransferase
MTLLFGCSLFLSATLLFLLQPLMGKMLLPYFGGSSAVWNTCLVFFQALLLAGYSYAHAAPAWLGTRRHVLVHLVLFAVAAVVLPVAVSAEAAPPPGVDPTAGLLGTLFIAVGLPFFVVSTTAPLVQHWFAATGHPSGRDPYFLYAASNAGSMVGLLAYPFLLEPLVGLRWQAIGWAAGYGLLLLSLAACALFVWRERATLHVAGPRTSGPCEPAAPSWPTRLRWVALAFVPSSLLLGVTTYLSMDVAPMPLLWVLPLAVYLLSFILVFGPMRTRGVQLFGRFLPLVVLAAVFFVVIRPSVPLEQQVAANLLTLFLAAVVCHGELARTRPDARHLTELYLWMSLGGVLGGAFNALAAPLLFSGTYEYPLGLVLLCLVAPQLAADPEENEPSPPQQARKRKQRSSAPVHAAARRTGPLPGRRGTVLGGLPRPSLLGAGLMLFVELVAASLLLLLLPPAVGPYAGLPALLGLSVWAKALRLGRFGEGQGKKRWDHLLDLALPGALAYLATCVGKATSFALAFSLLVPLGLSLSGRPLRLGLGVAVLLGIGLWERGTREQVAYRHRNFYGTHRVTGRYILYHGQTLHGSQAHTGNPADRKVPRTYYYPTGPAGDTFQAFVHGRPAARVGVIGLGAGSLAAYGEKGQHFTFFEIDPTVIELARGSEYFTYLRDSAAECEVIAGDARLMLRDQPRSSYDLLVIDAFSGDAVPTHLLTREALQLYRDLLAPGGRLLFHISNRYFDLEPILGNLAAAEGMVGVARYDTATAKEHAQGKANSHWVVLARRDEDIAPLKERRALFKLTGKALAALATVGAPAAVLAKLSAWEEQSRSEGPQGREEYLKDLAVVLDSKELTHFQGTILEQSEAPVVFWHSVRTRADLAPWTDDFSSLLPVLGRSDNLPPQAPNDR